jgi:hypothetical protein
LDREKIALNLRHLRSFSPPPPGGLDLVLNRIRKVDAPMVLFSGRLDAPPPVDPTELTPKPPGKTWQVVLAKHGEQMLVEKNRMLARRLAYRQMSVALLKRFQFTNEVRPLLDVFATVELQTAGPIVTAGETLTLTYDGNSVELAPTPNNVEELIDQLETNLPAQTVVDRWRVADDTEHLVLRGPVSELSLTSSANPPVEFFRARRPQPRSTTLPPSLPGPLTSIERHNPLATLEVESEDELRQLNLPDRLGRFGLGAVVYQWKGVPYYYERLLAAVAQSTDVVSAITSVVQRDFEYVSPEPRALMDACKINGARARRIRIRLENFWNCLPQDSDANAQQLWPMENPTTATPDQERSYSAVPDPAVVYQFVIERPGGVMQALSQIFFNADETECFAVRVFDAPVGDTTYNTEISRRLAWGDDPASPHDEYLETRLIAVDGGTAAKVSRAITSRHHLDEDKLSPEFSGTATLADPLMAEFPETLTLACYGNLTEQQIQALADLVIGGSRDSAFRIQAERFVQRVRDQLPLPPGDQSKPDIREEVSVGLDHLHELADDPNAAIVDAVLKRVTWVSDDPNVLFTDVQLRVLEGDNALAGGRAGWVTSPAAGDTLLALIEAGTRRIFDFVTNANIPDEPQPGDALYGRVTISAADGELRWSPAAVTQEHLDALQDWIDHAPPYDDSFLDAVRQLIEAVGVVKLGFQHENDVPTIDPGDPLYDRLVIDMFVETGELTWRLGDLTVEEHTALEQLADEASGYALQFRDRIRTVLQMTGQFVVQVAILEEDFAPRPTQADFDAIGVGESVGYLRGSLTFEDLMLRSEEESLEDACLVQFDVSVIKHLHDDSLRAGFNNAELKIMAYRGSAVAKTTPIQPYLTKER